MSEAAGGARPAAIRPGTATTVTQTSDIDRARRRWKLHQQFQTSRAISAALDAKCGIEAPEPAEVDYSAMGLDLGWAERRAAGIALAERERGA